MKFVKKKVRNILESNFFVRYLIHQTTTTNQIDMKTLKFNKVLKQIREGKIECVTDFKIGYVEIYNLNTRKRTFIKVI